MNRAVASKKPRDILEDLQSVDRSEPRNLFLSISQLTSRRVRWKFSYESFHSIRRSRRDITGVFAWGCKGNSRAYEASPPLDRLCDT